MLEIRRDSIGMILEGLYKNRQEDTVSEAYNVFKELKKVKDPNPNGSLPSGYVTDGEGGVYKVPTTGYSKIIKYKGASYRYNYKTHELEYLDGTKVVDSRGLSVGDWCDGPDYWVETYHETIQSEIEESCISVYEATQTRQIVCFKCNGIKYAEIMCNIQRLNKLKKQKGFKIVDSMTLSADDNGGRFLKEITDVVKKYELDAFAGSEDGGVYYDGAYGSSDICGYFIYDTSKIKLNNYGFNKATNESVVSEKERDYKLQDMLDNHKYNMDDTYITLSYNGKNIKRKYKRWYGSPNKLATFKCDGVEYTFDILDRKDFVSEGTSAFKVKVRDPKTGKLTSKIPGIEDKDRTKLNKIAQKFDIAFSDSALLKDVKWGSDGSHYMVGADVDKVLNAYIIKISFGVGKSSGITLEQPVDLAVDLLKKEGFSMSTPKDTGRNYQSTGKLSTFKANVFSFESNGSVSGSVNLYIESEEDL